MGKSLIILLGLGSLVSAWIIISIIVFGEPSINGAPISSSGTVESSQNLAVSGEQVITTWGNNKISAQPLLQHRDTVTLSPDEFYSNSSDASRYEIYYDEPSGNITILLTSTPLSFSRQLAETQLRQVLGVSDVEICRLEIRVAVNEAVSDQYARIGNLGLSFCQGAQSIID